MNQETQEKIIKGLQQGDQQAWEAFYDAYVDRLWRSTAMLMAYDRALIADIVQESFMAAARSAHTFDPQRGSLWTWLWTITRRQVALQYRRKRPSVGLADSAQAIPTSEPAPNEVLESQELAGLVQQSLTELPDDYQNLLLAKYVDNLPAQHIAQEINQTVVAVRSKLARARKAFRVVYERITQANPQSREVQL